MVLYGGKATKRNTVFKNKTSINTSNINNIIPSNSGRPSPVNQHTSDWRLKDIIPSFETPKAYADEVSTPVEPVPEVTKEYDNWYNKRSANAVTADNTDTSNMSVFDENNPDHIKNSGTKGESGGLFGGYFDHLFTSYDDPSHPNNYKEMEAAAEEQQGSTPTPPGGNVPTPEPFYKDPQPLPKGLSGQGSFTNPLTEKTTLATKPEGSELFTIPDYVKQVERSSYYGLGKNVDSETFKKTLNKQQINKFENKIQDKWSTLVRSGGVNDMSYLSLQQQITNSNLPIKEQERLIGIYSKKNKKLQNLTGGYDSPKSPNEAEQLGFKIADGTITRKELNKWNLLTGQDLPKSGKVTTKDGSMPRILTYEDLF